MPDCDLQFLNLFVGILQHGPIGFNSLDIADGKPIRDHNLVIDNDFSYIIPAGKAFDLESSAYCISYCGLSNRHDE